MSKICDDKHFARPYRNSQMKYLIDEYVHSERDRKILYRKLLDKRTFAQVSEEFGLSEVQVKRIVYQAEKVIPN